MNKRNGLFVGMCTLVIVLKSLCSAPWTLDSAHADGKQAVMATYRYDSLTDECVNVPTFLSSCK